MGPSHVFFLLALSACAMAMLPNNFGMGSMMPGVGMPGGLSSVGGGASLGMTGGASMGRGASFGMTGGSAMRGVTGQMLALQMYDRKKKILKNLIKLYESHGCIDPMQKLSNAFSAIITIAGCNDARANISCRQYGFKKVNLQTHVMQNAMPSTRQSHLVNQLQNMSPYNSFQDYIMGTVSQRQMNPVMLRMVYGNEGPGSGLAFSGERMDRIKNMRVRFLPYQCQDIKTMNINMGLCCPGPVSFHPQIEMRAMAGLLHV